MISRLVSGNSRLVEYNVIDTEYEISIGLLVVEEENTMELGNKPKSKTAIPRKYSNRTTSGLKAKIEKAGKNEFDFDLKSQ